MATRNNGIDVEQITRAMVDVFTSSIVADSDLGPANIVDAVYSLRRAVMGVTKAITATEAADGTDATGGNVSCLTEAVMGVTAGLVAIASAIEKLADASRGRL